MHRSVLFVATGLGRGGAETQLVRLAKHLKRRGWQVEIITMLDRRAFDPELEAAGIPLHCLHMRRGMPQLSGLWKTIAIMRKMSPSLVVTFMVHANILGRIAGKLARVPAVVTSIRNERFGGRFGDISERLLAPLADVVTTNSHLAADAMIDRGVVRRGKIEVVPNGIAIEDVTTEQDNRQATRDEIGVDTDDFLWLAVGNLRIQKDYQSLLKATAALVASGRQNIQLRIAGLGPLRDELEAQIEHLGLHDCVQLLGYRQDVPELLAACDAFVLSSAWEGLPNSIMEAMLARRPVVATNVGGVPELVEHDVTGFVVEPHKPHQLADKMAHVMDASAASRAQMGQAGREFITDNFAIETVVNRWEELFERLLTHKLATTKTI